MKSTLFLSILGITLFAAGCDKQNENPLTTEPAAVRFTTTGNVKTTPTYFSFDTGAATDSLGAWDIKMTYTYMMVDVSMPAIKYPFIGLNTGRGVTGKIVDGTDFSSLNGSTVSGLAADSDTTGVIGVNCLNYDGSTHRLNPYTNRGFVVQTGTGKRVKFAMVSYYNEAGTSGFMTIDYVKY